MSRGFDENDCWEHPTRPDRAQVEAALDEFKRRVVLNTIADSVDRDDEQKRARAALLALIFPEGR